MRLTELPLKSQYWVNRVGRFVAEISFSIPADRELFVVHRHGDAFHPDILDWLEEVMPQRYGIHIKGRIRLVGTYVLLFIDMKDAIHFKIRWS